MQDRSALRDLTEVAPVENIMTNMCTRGYPMSGGTLVFAGSGVQQVKPVQRERAIVGVIAVKTAITTVVLRAPIADHPTTFPSVQSALTCELRT